VAADSEQTFRHASGPPWRAEPFRLFFPLAVVLSWAGVGHWLLYALGLTATYSCELHGFVQMQAFMMSFAIGFLFTALPRRTQTAPPSPVEMMAMVTALLTTTVAALAERFVVLVLPLMGGSPPPADLGSSPRETRKAIAYAGAGMAILSSFALEYAGWVRAGPSLRAVVVAAGVGFGGGAWRPPGRSGFHRRLVWLSVWLIPIGLFVSALLPDLRVASLHVVFIGGFALMAFGVATHVSLGHLGLEHFAAGRPPAVVAMAVGLLLALSARVVADWSDSYFAHLGWAAASWIGGSGAWLAFLAPHFLGRKR
jgi:hypothetical protein